MTTRTISAPAKLTLTLRVTGVLDNGYHLIDADMVTLSLADQLTVTDADATSLHVDGRYSSGVPTDETNLVAKATALVGRPAHITLTKNIPHGGGLGGGSANAAAVLRWANHPTDTDGLQQAARIGADVPFCLIGGRARVQGIGDIITPLPHRQLTVTLVIPPLHVATPAVYQAWDDMGGPTAPGPNDLEPAAIRVQPELGSWRDRIAKITGRTPVLAGSGATWFVYGDHSNALTALRSEGAEVLAVTT